MYFLMQAWPTGYRTPRLVWTGCRSQAPARLAPAHRPERGGLLGYPQEPHPGKKLQALLKKESLQVKVTGEGLEALHANGYRTEYLERAHGSRRNLLSAFAFASKSAGLELFPLDHPKAIAPPSGQTPGPPVKIRPVCFSTPTNHS